MWNLVGMSNTYTPIGSSANLDELYAQLGELEQKEMDCISFGRLDLLADARKAMLPIKAQINKAEGFVIYPEAE